MAAVLTRLSAMILMLDPSSSRPIGERQVKCIITHNHSLLECNDFDDNLRIKKKSTCARRIDPSMFEGEALGLKAMYDTKSICVPLPYKVS